MVLKQKFLEQLEERQLPDALETLRLELTPIPGHENEVSFSPWVWFNEPQD